MTLYCFSAVSPLQAQDIYLSKNIILMRMVTLGVISPLGPIEYLFN